MGTPRTLTTPDGAGLAYRPWRSGAPPRMVVLLHGLASNLTRWSEFVATTRLTKSWELPRLDLRGLNRSLHRGRVGADEWCRDLSAILEAEEARQAVLVGHCPGANVGLHFAAHHPTAVRGLVLIEPMFRQALTGRLRFAAVLRPLLVPIAVLARWLNVLAIGRRRLATLDLEQLARHARAAIAAAGPGAFPEALYASLWRISGPLPPVPIWQVSSR